jgi:hypothetical protein
MATIIGASRWRQVFCVVLLSAIVLVALHRHSSIDPFDEQTPSGGHHCLLCIAAHQPSATSNTAIAPLPPGSRTIAVASINPHANREAQLAFSLYMRPPPAL